MTNNHVFYAHYHLGVAIEKADDAPASAAQHEIQARLALQLQRVPTVQEALDGWKTYEEHELAIERLENRLYELGLQKAGLEARLQQIEAEVTKRSPEDWQPIETLRATFTNEVIRAIGALARQQNVCREQAGQMVFVTGMEAAREYIVEHVSSALSAGAAPQEIAALKERVEKAGWGHSYGSLHVVYVNDVLDWLDELAEKCKWLTHRKAPSARLEDYVQHKSSCEKATGAAWTVVYAEHVCGLQGYCPGAPHYDPPCPGCTEKPKQRATVCTCGLDELLALTRRERSAPQEQIVDCGSLLCPFEARAKRYEAALKTIAFQGYEIPRQIAEAALSSAIAETSSGDNQ